MGLQIKEDGEEQPKFADLVWFLKMYNLEPALGHVLELAISVSISDLSMS
jgi:hypothetical protein